MGQGASNPGAVENLPEIIEESVAQDYLGDCFQRAEWESLSMGTGSVHKQAFVDLLNERNFPPTFRTWLESWRIADLLPKLTEMGIEDPVGISKLEATQIATLEMKPVQKRHFTMAAAHANYLSQVGLTMPFSPLGVRRAAESITVGSTIKFPNVDDEGNVVKTKEGGEQETSPVEEENVVTDKPVEESPPQAETENTLPQEAETSSSTTETPVQPTEPEAGEQTKEEETKPSDAPAVESAPTTPVKATVDPDATPVASPECPPSPGGSGLSAARALANSPQQEDS
jgi:hypothetical protein